MKSNNLIKLIRLSIFVGFAAMCIFAVMGTPAHAQEGDEGESAPESTTYIPTNTQKPKHLAKYEATVAYIAGQDPMTVRHARVSISSKLADIKTLDEGETFLDLDSENHGDYLWVTYVKLDGLFTVGLQRVAKDGSSVNRIEIPFNFQLNDFEPHSVEIEIDKNGVIYVLVAGAGGHSTAILSTDMYLVSSQDQGQTWFGVDKPIVSTPRPQIVRADPPMRYNAMRNTLHILTAQSPFWHTANLIEYTVDLTRGTTSINLPANAYTVWFPCSPSNPICRNSSVMNLAVGPNEGFSFLHQYDPARAHGSGVFCESGWFATRKGSLPWGGGGPFKQSCNLVESDMKGIVTPERQLIVALATVEKIVDSSFGFGGSSTGEKINLHISDPGANTISWIVDIPIANESGKEYSGISLTRKDGNFLFSFVEGKKNLKVKQMLGTKFIEVPIETTSGFIFRTDIEPIF